MAVTANCFTKGAILSAFTKKIDLTADGIRVLLATSATTGLAAAEDTIQFMSDVKAVAGWTEVANAAGGSSYVFNANSTSSGLAIASPTFTISGDVYTLTSGTNPAWTTAAAGFAPAYAIFYDSTPGTDATNPALGYWDLGGAQAGGGGTWTLQLSGSGIITITA